MPDEQEQATAVEAPVEPAQEPSRAATIKKGKADLEALRKEPSPAEKTPDSTATSSADEEAAASTEKTTEAKADKEGSRREQGKGLREQIRKEILSEMQADQQAAQARQQVEQQQREFEDLLTKADEGDYEAKDRVLQILKSTRGMQAAIAQGRTAVVEELGRDLVRAVNGLDGLDESAQAELLKAPSIAEFGKQTFQQGRRIEKAVQEDAIAKLKAENESLKGQLAGNRPSPTATNGTSVTRQGNQRFSSMQEAFNAAAAELNYRPQG
jgi:hypothetical protein